MAHAMSVETPNSTIAGNLAAAAIGRPCAGFGAADDSWRRTGKRKALGG
jgi:hypothetical protein